MEADESDRSMLELNVELALLTNVELDHHASFASLRELREAFREFLRGPRTAVIWDRPELLALREGPLVAYDARRGDADRRRLELSLARARGPPGGARRAQRAQRRRGARGRAAGGRRGAARGRRRWRLSAAPRGAFSRSAAAPRGALVYDDYAHHPTEVAATLEAARSFQPRRLLAVFQPHLFSRTARWRASSARALALADAVVVLEYIRPASGPRTTRA